MEGIFFVNRFLLRMKTTNDYPTKEDIMTRAEQLLNQLHEYDEWSNDELLAYNPHEAFPSNKGRLKRGLKRTMKVGALLTAGGLIHKYGLHTSAIAGAKEFGQSVMNTPSVVDTLNALRNR
jgi:hypothetical protein